MAPGINLEAINSGPGSSRKSPPRPCGEMDDYFGGFRVQVHASFGLGFCSLNYLSLLGFGFWGLDH